MRVYGGFRGCGDLLWYDSLGAAVVTGPPTRTYEGCGPYALASGIGSSTFGNCQSAAHLGAERRGIVATPPPVACCTARACSCHVGPGSVLSGRNIWVGVQLDVEPASIEEHLVGVRLELVHLARGGVTRLVGPLVIIAGPEYHATFLEYSPTR